MRYSKFLALIFVFFALVSQASSAAENSKIGQFLKLQRDIFDMHLYWRTSEGELRFKPACISYRDRGFYNNLEAFLYDTFIRIDLVNAIDRYDTPHMLVCHSVSFHLPYSYRWNNRSFNISGLDESSCTGEISTCRANHLLDMAAKQASISVTVNNSVFDLDLSRLIGLNDLVTLAAIDAHETSKNHLYKAIPIILFIWLVVLVFAYWLYKRHLKSWIKAVLYGFVVILGLVLSPFIGIYRKVFGKQYAPTSVADELYKLKLLRESEEISEDEYLLLKNRLLR
jgi:hypothetical protein